MILKSLSRKSSPDKLIKYIFKEQLVYPEDKPADRSHKTHWYVPGVHLTEKDIQYLAQEKEDATILKELRLFKGTVQEFIQQRLLTQEQKERPFIITHNTRARSLNGFYKAFAENEARRLYTRSDQVSVHHVILSWPPKHADKITDAMLKDMTEEYLRLRPNCLVVGTKHTGRGHPHIHLAVAGSLLNGKSARQSKAEFQRIKDKLIEYERTKYPFLSHSFQGKEKGAAKEKSASKNKNPERALEKDALLQCLDEVYSTSASREHFLSQLESLGHTPYFRAGKFQGLMYNGETKHRIYRYGYDEAKLLALDAKKAEIDKQLQEMRKLRNKGQALEKKHAQDMPPARRALLYEETTDPRRQEEKRAAQQELVNAGKKLERVGVTLSGIETNTDRPAPDKKDAVVQAEDKANKGLDTLRELHSLRGDAGRDMDTDSRFPDNADDSESQEDEDTDGRDSDASTADNRPSNDEPDDDTNDAE